ncbi:hypothetical protein CL1_1799 [Thermococcus cleftensis]|uniref:Uncharacterized protein n=1 Tax=Thermococcus cleftensis (strain DSM 27260 / KACC 17922 / CL1) TaxID=163003 RepID=I3ZWB1_THECF|nr:hypothetical protein CL1_1799 [Thermococcus cleftensis]
MWKDGRAGGVKFHVHAHVSVGQNCVESAPDIYTDLAATISFRRTELCGKKVVGMMEVERVILFP